MARKKPFAPCVFVPYSHRDNLPSGSCVYDVSSYADHPCCTLSPMWVHGGIPVPGMPGTTSDTVEGIWQGLKVIRGTIAPRYFKGPGQKRGGKPAGHRFGERLLKIVEARQQIYRVAYEWMLDNRAEPALLEQFVEQAFAGVTQYFHDVSDNGDINNPDEGWAHAAVLVQYLNRRCMEQVEAGKGIPEALTAFGKNGSLETASADNMRCASRGGWLSAQRIALTCWPPVSSHPGIRCALGLSHKAPVSADTFSASAPKSGACLSAS